MLNYRPDFVSYVFFFVILCFFRWGIWFHILISNIAPQLIPITFFYVNLIIILHCSTLRLLLLYLNLYFSTLIFHPNFFRHYFQYWRDFSLEEFLHPTRTKIRTKLLRKFSHEKVSSLNLKTGECHSYPKCSISNLSPWNKLQFSHCLIVEKVICIFKEKIWKKN